MAKRKRDTRGEGNNSNLTAAGRRPTAGTLFQRTGPFRPAHAATFLSLQRTVGNQAVQRQHAASGTDPASVLDLDLSDRPTLYPGLSGPYVELAQNKLRAGIPTLMPVAISGDFDATTRDLVVHFQRKMKLAPDGIIGPQTWAALDSVARGQRLSDEDDDRLRTRTDEARDLYGAGQYQAALDLLNDMYADPLLDAKPVLSARIIWGLASCHHQLALGDHRSAAERRQELAEAISWYQDYLMLPGTGTDRIVNATIRIREARLGRPPTAYTDLFEMMEEMN